MGPVWRQRRASEQPGRLSALPLLELCWSRLQREIRDLFWRGGQDSAPSWAASRHETALPAHRARCRGLHDGVGRRPMRHRGNSGRSPGLRLRFFRGVHAGSWAPGTAPAEARLPRAWGADASRDADLCCLCSRRVLRRSIAAPVFKLWSSEPLVKISHSCLPVPNRLVLLARKACAACKLRIRPLSPV